MAALHHISHMLKMYAAYPKITTRQMWALWVVSSLGFGGLHTDFRKNGHRPPL